MSENTVPTVKIILIVSTKIRQHQRPSDQYRFKLASYKLKETLYLEIDPKYIQRTFSEII